MKLNEPLYRLLQMDPHEWRFEESAEMDEVTGRFDDLLEQHRGRPKFTSALRKFLNDYPNHFDALHHYAMCKLDEGKPLDAFAFAHAAVAIARSVFPKEFVPGTDRLPDGWTQNRPFLRALHGLMLAQDAVFDRRAAIATARELIAFDPDDRMGARLSLPEYLLAESRNVEALAVFSMPGFDGTFHTVEYLRALALIRLNRDSEASDVLASCLSNYPQVARFMLEPTADAPADGASGWGITSGSPFEGWYYGIRFLRLWHTPVSALIRLREAAAPIAAAGWPRWFSKPAGTPPT